MNFEQAYDKAVHSACDMVNAYYDVIGDVDAPEQDQADADYCYYRAIEVLSKFFGMSENLFEDACTDTRERGWDND